MFIYYLASSCLLQHAIFTITFICAFITLKVCNVHHRTLKVNYRNERWSRCKVLSLTATDLQLLHCLLIHLSDVQCRNTRSVTKVYFHHFYSQPECTICKRCMRGYVYLLSSVLVPCALCSMLYLLFTVPTLHLKFVKYIIVRLMFD